MFQFAKVLQNLRMCKKIAIFFGIFSLEESARRLLFRAREKKTPLMSENTNGEGRIGSYLLQTKC